jgi:hypothetical protein
VGVEGTCSDKDGRVFGVYGLRNRELQQHRGFATLKTLDRQVRDPTVSVGIIHAWGRTIMLIRFVCAGIIDRGRIIGIISAGRLYSR